MPTKNICLYSSRTLLNTDNKGTECPHHRSTCTTDDPLYSTHQKDRVPKLKMLVLQSNFLNIDTKEKECPHNRSVGLAVKPP